MAITHHDAARNRRKGGSEAAHKLRGLDPSGDGEQLCLAIVEGDPAPESGRSHGCASISAGRRASLKPNQASDSKAKSVSIWPASAMTSLSEPEAMPPATSANMKRPVSSAAAPIRHSLPAAL